MIRARSIVNPVVLLRLLLFIGVSIFISPGVFAQSDTALLCPDPNADTAAEESQAASNFPTINLFPLDNKEPDAFSLEADPNLPTQIFQFDGDLHLLPVQGNVYVLMGAGGNITLQIRNVGTEDGVLLVDSGRAESSAAVLSAIHQITTAPIRTIINTSDNGQHSGGNIVLGQDGARLVTNQAGNNNGEERGAAIIAREEVMIRMIVGGIEDCGWPNRTYSAYPRLTLFFNGEGIRIMHMPDAITDGDSVVHFRGSDVVSTGDIFNTDRYPPIDLDLGGSINGVVAALNELLEITIPALKNEGGTYVIPGHGRIADEADVAEYRDMATIIRDRIKTYVERGMSLEEVQEQHPTLEYDGRYDRGLSPETFVEIVYQSLSQSGGSE
jgi:glyoxylase-like metal-dependent hydrolase (beta-lactamase superfamily II)